MKRIISVLLLSIFLFTSNSLALNKGYCTPEVKQQALFIETELQCKLAQLTLDYIKLNCSFEVDVILATDKKYGNYYGTITLFKSKKGTDWNPKEHCLKLLFDMDFNIVRIE